MLDNKDRKLIYDKYKDDNDASLTNYLKNKEKLNILHTNDLMLFEHFSTDIKSKIIEEVEI